ncbi:hypothetical protein SEA_VROOMVROOM_4 [Arthrobacter phage VroomVroom]|uniref:MuF-like minor capsid protein n=1 Tax=Arthrobacter phage VroomVroom TaxID=3049371 RepID=A0AA49FAB5_9CAUD|nr:hypothetical protein SEA_VROOMVROOM_4 [Arthrobacter phage VroomVroom]
MRNGHAIADAHRVQQVRLTAPLQGILAEVWRRTIVPGDLDRTFPLYLAAAEVVLGQGRMASHALARRYYMTVASQAGEDPVAAGLALSPLDRAAIETSLRVTGPVLVKSELAKGVGLEAAMQAGLAATIAAGKRIILDGGREMLVEASRRDPNVQGWARISDGSSCSFCAMLVSRGPVYGERTVAFRSHDRCGCGVRLVYRQDADRGWGPDAAEMEQLWKDHPNTAEFRAALKLKRGETKRSNLLGKTAEDLQTSADVSRETRAA